MKKLLFAIICLLTSTTYGQWAPIPAPDDQFFGVDFADENTGFLRAFTELYKTTDGGNTWQSVVIPGEGDNPRDIFVIDEHIVWCSETSNAMHVDGILSKSVDGGNTWQVKLSSDSCEFRSVYFFNENLGWLCTNHNYYYYTTDGGETWSGSGIMPLPVIRDLLFVNENTGWMIGGGGSGIVAKTTDGGATWEMQLNTPLVDYYFLEVEFVNEQIGYVGGHDRTLFMTENGGETWEVIASEVDPGILEGVPADYDIRGIEFMDENIGWIVGGHC